MTDMEYQPVAKADDVAPGTVSPVEVAGRAILLCHSGGRIFAVENKCSHADEKLECGRMKSGWIACPLHGARFRLDTGLPMNPPATQPIGTFAVRVVDGTVEVAVT